ncbi:DoxX family protein [Nocardia alni]|uniref:DoxX family protein n=1 Tax=Nocardia alni TaxID=2815723 RepID=UPI001C233C42|nr:DoxX family protein [Nocardia alni]
MFLAYLTVTIVTIALNGAIAVADFARAEFVLANSAEVGVAPSWVPITGVLKAAGAVGLVLGLLGGRPLGIAASIGLVLFFIGALIVHVRARVFHNIAFPATYFAFAVGSLVLALAQ